MAPSSGTITYNFPSCLAPYASVDEVADDVWTAVGTFSPCIEYNGNVHMRLRVPDGVDCRTTRRITSGDAPEGATQHAGIPGNEDLGFEIYQMGNLVYLSRPRDVTTGHLPPWLEPGGVLTCQRLT